MGKDKMCFLKKLIHTKKDIIESEKHAQLPQPLVPSLSSHLSNQKNHTIQKPSMPFVCEDPIRPTGNQWMGIMVLSDDHLGFPLEETGACLIRKNTGERIDISCDSFKLGRDRKFVDYCIDNNKYISRVHATIIFGKGVFYIRDNQSINYTYINGNRIPAREEIVLNVGDCIKLADEEFIFSATNVRA